MVRSLDSEITCEQLRAYFTSVYHYDSIMIYEIGSVGYSEYHIPNSIHNCTVDVPKEECYEHGTIPCISRTVRDGPPSYEQPYVCVCLLLFYLLKQFLRRNVPPSYASRLGFYLFQRNASLTSWCQTTR